MNKRTQIQKIVDYAEKHGVFTMREIYTDCFINSPTARMSDMRKLGYKFAQKWKETEGSRYLSYEIVCYPQVECENCKVGGGA